MKFFLDNNLPPALARALDSLSVVEWDEPIKVIHLRDKYRGDVKDEEWITGLAGEAGWVVITQDKLKKGLEREALRRAGLKVFMLDSSWVNHAFWDKATNLIKWWPAIVDQSERIQGGAAFRVKWNFSGKGKFQQITV